MLVEDLNMNEVVQLEQMLRDDIRAVERVRVMIEAHKSKLRATESLSRESKTIEACILEAVGRMPSSFTLADLLAELTSAYPASSFKKNTISSVFANLKKAGGLRVVVPGKGRKPALYEKIKGRAEEPGAAAH